MKESQTGQAIDVLAIGAHPDDAELCCAGYLIKAARTGHTTGIIDLSSGDMGTRGTPETRAAEAEHASKVMGITYRECLHIPDGHIRHTEENIAKVAAVIRKLRPKIILTSYWEDHHPDHHNTSRIVKDAWWFAGVAKYPLEGEVHRAERILYWVARYRVEPSLILDVSDVYDTKLKAVECYTSQLHQPDSDEPRTHIADESFLDGWRARQRALGMSIGVMYGEGYVMRTPVPLSDPFAVTLGVPGNI